MNPDRNGSTTSASRHGLPVAKHPTSSIRRPRGYTGLMMIEYERRIMQTDEIKRMQLSGKMLEIPLTFTVSRETIENARIALTFYRDWMLAHPSPGSSRTVYPSGIEAEDALRELLGEPFAFAF